MISNLNENGKVWIINCTSLEFGWWYSLNNKGMVGMIYYTDNELNLAINYQNTVMYNNYLTYFWKEGSQQVCKSPYHALVDKRICYIQVPWNELGRTSGKYEMHIYYNNAFEAGCGFTIFDDGSLGFDFSDWPIPE